MSVNSSPEARYQNTGRMQTLFCEYYERGRSKRGILCDVKHRDGTWTLRVWVSYEAWKIHNGTTVEAS